MRPAGSSSLESALPPPGAFYELRLNSTSDHRLYRENGSDDRSHQQRFLPRRLTRRHPARRGIAFRRFIRRWSRRWLRPSRWRDGKRWRHRPGPRRRIGARRKRRHRAGRNCTERYREYGRRVSPRNPLRRLKRGRNLRNGRGQSMKPRCNRSPRDIDPWNLRQRRSSGLGRLLQKPSAISSLCLISLTAI